MEWILRKLVDPMAKALPQAASNRLLPNWSPKRKIWNQICQHANVSGKTPHCARHAVGKAIIDKTGNVAAVQRQLGHKSAASSMQYARPKQEDILRVLDEVL